MPTLKELKNMLKAAESAVEAEVESLFEEQDKVEAPKAAVKTEAAPDPAPVSAEPVFEGNKPYGLVDGIPGVKYQQGGAYFNNVRKFVRKE
jgi:hypothetical protein